MDHRPELPRELQLGLGKLLRSHYKELFRSIPPDLAGLAQKILVIPNLQSERSAISPALVEVHELEGLDPETVAILQSAFQKAWGDLDHLTENPTTHKALAARLIELLELGERDPSRLATKAVLDLVAPRGAV